MTAVAELLPGAIGFDSDTKLDAATAVAMKHQGYSFAVRYVGRHVPQSGGDLDPDEAKAILGAGLALMVVQHCPLRFTPTAELGRLNAIAAVTNAGRAGYPAGAHLWCDFENARGTAQQAIDYLNAWFKEVLASKFDVGLYYGADTAIDGTRLYLDLICKRYWRSGSRLSPLVAHRGHCMQQELPTVVAGIEVDRDVVTADHFGGLPVASVA